MKKLITPLYDIAEKHYNAAKRSGEFKRAFTEGDVGSSDAYIFSSDIRDFGDVFMAGHALSIGKRTAVKDLDERLVSLKNYDPLKKIDFCEKFLQYQSHYPHTAAYFIAMNHLRYVLIDYIENCNT